MTSGTFARFASPLSTHPVPAYLLPNSRYKWVVPLCSDIFYVIAEMARTLNRGVVAERAKPTHALISFELLGRSRLASSKSPREFNECFFFDFPRAHDCIAESAFLVSCYAVVVTCLFCKSFKGFSLLRTSGPGGLSL